VIKLAISGHLLTKGRSSGRGLALQVPLSAVSVVANSTTFAPDLRFRSRVRSSHMRTTGATNLRAARLCRGLVDECRLLVRHLRSQPRHEVLRLVVRQLSARILAVTLLDGVACIDRRHRSLL
jgi:hypothetical protein